MNHQLFHSSALRTGRRTMPFQIYHLRASTLHRRHIFKDFAAARALIHAMQKQSEHCDTLCFVIMPDHFHWLIQLKKEPREISRIIQGVKISTSAMLRGTTEHKIWQKGFYDRALRREEDVKDVARFIVMNPVRAGIAGSVREYSHWDAVYF